MLNIGLIMPTLQLHLQTFDLAQYSINYMYSSYCGGYAVQAILLSVYTRYSQRGSMVVGLLGLCCSFVMMGPWTAVLPDSVYIVGASLPLFGLMLSTLYSEIYVVPVQPHMILVAKETYGYPDDDRLNDMLSSLTQMTLAAGEIVGPVFGALLMEVYSFKELAVTVAAINLGYAGITILGSVGGTHKQQGEAYVPLL